VAEAKLGLTLPQQAHQRLQLQVSLLVAETCQLHKLPFLPRGQEIFIQVEQTRLVRISLIQTAVLAARRGQMALVVAAVAEMVFLQAGTVEVGQPTAAVLVQREAQHLAALAAQDV
jgi:hypothetical protein